jgi:hypothetical protein
VEAYDRDINPAFWAGNAYPSVQEAEYRRRLVRNGVEAWPLPSMRGLQAAMASCNLKLLLQYAFKAIELFS